MLSVVMSTYSTATGRLRQEDHSSPVLGHSGQQWETISNKAKQNTLLSTVYQKPTYNAPKQVKISTLYEITTPKPFNVVFWYLEEELSENKWTEIIRFYLACQYNLSW